MATDFFHVDSVTLRRYYILFVIEVDSRVVQLLGATTNPVMGWVVQVVRNFTSDLYDTGRRFRFLIRDRDTKFTASFDEVFKAIGIEAIRAPVRSPKANAFAERWVRTARQDCLDHLLAYSRRHLESVLGDYLRHYNEARPHRGRQLATALPRHGQPRTGEICRRDILGGIVHEYDRPARGLAPGVQTARSTCWPSTTIHGFDDEPPASITSSSEATCKVLVPSAASTDACLGKAPTHLRHRVLGPFRSWWTCHTRPPTCGWSRSRRRSAPFGDLEYLGATDPSQ